MKKKFSTILLGATLAVGILVPVGASAAETWNRGFDKVNMQHYSNYYHSSYYHGSGIIQNGFHFQTTPQVPGKFSYAKIDFTGPYATTYTKYIQ